MAALAAVVVLLTAGVPRPAVPMAAGRSAHALVAPVEASGAGSRLPPSSPAAPRPLANVAALGSRTARSVPASSSQVVVVRGDAESSAKATVELYERSSQRWVRTARWRGHNGARGWTTSHREGDLRSPVGTYSLSDAGGRKADPGTAMPYHRSDRFVPTGDSVFGDSLEGSFDYVVAIDYNRRTGRSPLDTTRPLGRSRGGGIWLHVDHGGPTHGCVSLPEPAMVTLLAALRPDRRPMVIMGPPAALRL